MAKISTNGDFVEDSFHLRNNFGFKIKDKLLRRDLIKSLNRVFDHGQFFPLKKALPQLYAGAQIVRLNDDYFTKPISFKAGPNSLTIIFICLPHSAAPIGDVSLRPEFAR